MQPALVSSSAAATEAGFELGDAFVLKQALPDANAGRMVEVTWDVDFAGLMPGGLLSLQIDRGNLGMTRVTIYNYLGETPISVQVFEWSGVTSGRNSSIVSLQADKLIIPPQ